MRLRLPTILISAAAALFTLFSASAGAQVRTLDDVIRAGVLRVAVNPNLPAISAYGRTNQLEGFDIDVAEQLADMLGVKAEYIPTPPPQRVPFLTAGRADIALGALTRTATRARVIDFSAPLHTESMSVLTTDRISIANWEQLNDPEITLVDVRGNLSVELLRERLPEARVLLVDNAAEAVRAVAQGRAQAIVENIDFFIRFTDNHQRVNWRVLEGPAQVGYCSIGLSRGNDSLRRFLNIALFELHSNGFINARWEHWFGAPMTVPIHAQPYF